MITNVLPPFYGSQCISVSRCFEWRYIIVGVLLFRASLLCRRYSLCGPVGAVTSFQYMVHTVAQSDITRQQFTESEKTKL